MAVARTCKVVLTVNIGLNMMYGGIYSKNIQLSLQ
jgi:hypothetical protein